MYTWTHTPAANALRALLPVMLPLVELHLHGVSVVRLTSDRWEIAGGAPLALDAAADALALLHDADPLLGLRASDGLRPWPIDLAAA